MHLSDFVIRPHISSCAFFTSLCTICLQGCTSLLGASPCLEWNSHESRKLTCLAQPCTLEPGPGPGLPHRGRSGSGLAGAFLRWPALQEASCQASRCPTPPRSRRLCCYWLQISSEGHFQVSVFLAAPPCPRCGIRQCRKYVHPHFPWPASSCTWAWMRLSPVTSHRGSSPPSLSLELPHLSHEGGLPRAPSFSEPDLHTPPALLFLTSLSWLTFRNSC